MTGEPAAVRPGAPEPLQPQTDTLAPRLGTFFEELPDELHELITAAFFFALIIPYVIGLATIARWLGEHWR